MAKIRPFRAIRPNPFYISQLVFTKPQSESASGEENGGLKPLKTLLETGARQRPETPEGQMAAYHDIRETFQNLLDRDQLWQEESPAIYIYEVIHPTYRQTGVWALTSLDDYHSSAIKTHELTFADSVRRIRNYRAGTGLEGSPVLLAYPPDGTVNAVIAVAKTGRPHAVFGNQQGFHRVWKIEDQHLQETLIDAFGRIKTVYLADGHHRLEAAAMIKPEADAITSLYMATDELRIQEYDRVVIPGSYIDQNELVRELSKHFFIQDSRKPVRPKEAHRFGMCLNGEWYHLLVKAHSYIGKTLSENIDAAILQQQVFAPMFGITDPKTNPQLKSVGGEKAMEEIVELLHSHPAAIAFTLFPLTIEQIIAVADAGEVLPPKSTWIDPKVPYGLILYQHPLNENR